MVINDWMVVWNIFPFSWECHHPNWRSPSFFRGVGWNHQPDYIWLSLKMGYSPKNCVFFQKGYLRWITGGRDNPLDKATKTSRSVRVCICAGTYTSDIKGKPHSNDGKNGKDKGQWSQRLWYTHTLSERILLI